MTNCSLPAHISKETIELDFIYKDKQIDLENTIELLSRVNDYLLLEKNDEVPSE